METIIMRHLSIEDCDRIKEIDASQYIKQAWREVDGKRILVTIDYFDPDFPGGYDEHKEALRQTILSNGVALGLFNAHDKLVGFATINPHVYGKRYKYVLLDQLFITKEFRKKGLGKRLFMHCIDEIKNWPVNRVYICAGSAEETIAFYFSIGCKEAEEINLTLYNEDPRDYQLEYVL